MQGSPVSEQITQWMVDVSGLPVDLIGRLYRMGPVPAVESGLSDGLFDDFDGFAADHDAAVAGEWSAGR
ncbi:hypothetical protein FQZ97_1267910 [compost metagenome]